MSYNLLKILGLRGFGVEQESAIAVPNGELGSGLVVVLDNNMAGLAEALKNGFPEYKIIIIPSEDVRDKKETVAKPAIEGLIDYGGTLINEKYDLSIDTLIKDIDGYLV